MQASDAGSSEQPTGRVVAVVLAAGAAERFGATKQLVEVGGRPLVAHAVATAHAGGADHVVVVVGHDADVVGRAAGRGGPVEVVVNPAYRDGQATSLAAGIDAAQRRSGDVAVILLADQPGIDADAVRAVIAAVDAGATAARLRYQDGPGHPVAFARAVWPRLSEIRGDQGARDLFAELHTVEVAWSGPVPADVDTPGDLPGDPSGR